MSSSLSNVFAAAQEQTRELPMSPYAFFAIAFLSFMVLLGVLWGFRGTAQKLAAGTHHGEHGGSGAQQGGHH